MDENDPIQLFEDREIRTAWDEEREAWYVSVQDVVAVLADSADPKHTRRCRRKLADASVLCKVVQRAHRKEPVRVCLISLHSPAHLIKVRRSASRRRPFP